MYKLSLGYSAVPPKAKKLILEVLGSGQFSPGAKVREFEKRFAELHKSKYAIFVNSGTDALRLSLLALKEKYAWKDGSSVAVPALTFVATVNVILQAGLKPFFVDVGMYDYLINPWNLDHRIRTSTEKPVAVMPVHLFGQRCDDEIFTLAQRHKLKVLEDSCETILNPVQGDASCHSTYMAHHVTTGVGGLALTNDAILDSLIRSLANHGRDISYLPGHVSLPLGRKLLERRFTFDRIGYSSRATEFEAALGLSQLDSLGATVNKRKEVFSELKFALSIFPELTFVEAKNNTCMMFPIVLEEAAKADKVDLCLHLEKAGIETRDMMPITSQPCYKTLVNENDFPVAKRINKTGFYIPCHQAMTHEDVSLISSVFRSYFK